MSRAPRKRHHVFVGAPPASALLKEPEVYHWHVASAASSEMVPELGYPSTTLEAASHRISRIYENMIFKDSEEVSDEGSGETNENVERQGGQEQTTLITWAQTQNESGMQSGAVADTFFRASPSRVQSLIETQETQGGTSYNYSDASSIARFPDFHFNLHSLVDFSSLKLFQGSRKVCILLAVLETEGPDTIRLKKGLEAGKEIYVFNMILGNEDGVVCKLTAWREVAETWGGVGPATGIKRGDVVFFENVSATCEPQSPVILTASPNLKSKAEICYRTMPRAAIPADGRLRPDLRLGFSDAAVRRVASVVNWFEKMAGLVPS